MKRFPRGSSASRIRAGYSEIKKALADHGRCFLYVGERSDFVLYDSFSHHFTYNKKDGLFKARLFILRKSLRYITDVWLLSVKRIDAKNQ